jgi:hypothetical protein
VVDVRQFLLTHTRTRTRTRSTARDVSSMFGPHPPWTCKCAGVTHESDVLRCRTCGTAQPAAAAATTVGGGGTTAAVGSSTAASDSHLASLLRQVGTGTPIGKDKGIVEKKAEKKTPPHDITTVSSSDEVEESTARATTASGTSRKPYTEAQLAMHKLRGAKSAATRKAKKERLALSGTIQTEDPGWEQQPLDALSVRHDTHAETDTGCVCV